MASQLMTNYALMEALRTIIALPKGITSLDLRMRMDEVPTLSLTAHVYDSGGNPVIDRALMQVVERTIVGEVQPESWLDQRARQASEQVAQWFAALREKHDDAYDEIGDDLACAMYDLQLCCATRGRWVKSQTR